MKRINRVYHELQKTVSKLRPRVMMMRCRHLIRRLGRRPRRHTASRLCSHTRFTRRSHRAVLEKEKKDGNVVTVAKLLSCHTEIIA